MSRQPSLAFTLTTPRLRISAQEAPWDTTVFGAPVVQIQDVELLNRNGALADYTEFKDWLDIEEVGMVSCRLAHGRLQESMFLEANGFRFVEMVLHPRLGQLQELSFPTDELRIAPAVEEDLGALQEIAERAFTHERFHADPRIDSRLGNQRYGRWVRNSLHHSAQHLLKVLDGEHLVALFMVETMADLTVYWHLTAIAPHYQGRGYGRRVWRAMLRRHRAEGCDAVTTTISARNTPVLNLYAQLSFRFLPPEMTFHWVRAAE